MPANAVISASRRTDIPAFYMDWFMSGIKKGYFETTNPINRKKTIRKVSPESVHTIVFWSKNFLPFLRNGYGERLNQMGYNLFFNVTVNSDSPILEPWLPPIEDRVSQLSILAERFGPEAINWRFDPVCFYEVDNQPSNNLNDLDYICQKASEAGIRRCITSFLDIYRKIERRLSVHPEIKFIDPADEIKIDAVLRIYHATLDKGINLSLCCEPKTLNLLPDNITFTQSACIDNTLLKSLYGDGISLAKDSGQRSDMGCGCKKSIDIGDYQQHPCYHNCLYCYANPCEPPIKG